MDIAKGYLPHTRYCGFGITVHFTKRVAPGSRGYTLQRQTDIMDCATV